jgi:hypothetical protein
MDLLTVNFLRRGMAMPLQIANFVLVVTLSEIAR